jgi:hypothetical protein
MTTSPANSNDWIDFWENEMPQLTPQREMHIGELDKSIIALSKRKLKLLQEVNDINENISFLRKQQEDLTDV